MEFLNDFNQNLIRSTKKTIITYADWEVFISPYDNKYYVHDHIKGITNEVDLVAEMVVSSVMVEALQPEQFLTMLGPDAKFDYCGEADKLVEDGSAVFMWFKSLTNKAIYNPHKHVCPYCGSPHIDSHGYGEIEEGSVYEDFLCGDCERTWKLWFKLVNDGAWFNCIETLPGDPVVASPQNFTQQECEQQLK